MEIHVQKIFVRLAYLCSEKLSLCGVELDLIYVRRWQKCPILCSKLTPYACDISKLFPAGRVQRNLQRDVTTW